MDGELSEAKENQAIVLTLDREIDVSRGEVFSDALVPLENTDQFEATIVWMSHDSGHIGRTYDLKLSSQWTQASITSIKHQININNFSLEASKTLELNEICVCNISTIKCPLHLNLIKNQGPLVASF